jgi:FAD/FMN-containing dehydrogenase
LFYIQTYIVGIPKVPQQAKNFLTTINRIIEDSMPDVRLGAYAGYVDPALSNPQEQYWDANYPRLQQIKSKYDPDDVFYNPQVHIYIP